MWWLRHLSIGFMVCIQGFGLTTMAFVVPQQQQHRVSWILPYLPQPQSTSRPQSKSSVEPLLKARYTPPTLVLSNEGKDRFSISHSSASTSSRLYGESSIHGWREYYRSRRIDDLLSHMTTAFPLFVSSAALVGLLQPSWLLWVNRGFTVTALLAAVMWGTGLTLQKKDFTDVWASSTNRAAIPLGVACQFGIMPLSALLVGKALLLQSGSTTTVSAVQQALFIGLCLVGCAPGGTASNLVSLIAEANVALSVILTTCSTLAAVVMTPLLVKLLVGTTATTALSTAALSISGWSLCAATAKVVVLPILLGMMFKSKAPQTAETVSRFTPFASVLLVSVICGGVVAQTAPLLRSSSTLAAASSAATSFSGLGVLLALGLTTAAPLVSLLALPFSFLRSTATTSTATAAASATTSGAVSLPVVALSVLLLHIMGFSVGYVIPKMLYPKQEKTARTISIEVGMQNSALAVVLARSIAGIHPAAALPGAISATVHSCLGSMLAAFWRLNKPNDE